MRSAVVSLLAVTAAAVVACRSAQQKTPATSPTPAPGPTTAQAPAPGSAPGGAPGARPAGRPRPSPAALDSMRRGMVARLLTEAAGHENDPAGEYFKNVKMWKTLPVRAFLDTMNSYGRAMGNTCTGCHIANEWAKDDRKNKGIARQMQHMVDDMNAQYLAKMPELDDDHPPVTCAMCHAGSGHPKKDVQLVPNGAPNGAPNGPPPAGRPGLD